MDLQQAQELSNGFRVAFSVLNELQQEAREAILSELAGILAYDNAQELADQIEAELPSVEKKVKTSEARKRQSQAKVEELENEFIQLQADRDRAQQDVARALAKGEPPNRVPLAALEIKLNETSGALSTARAERQVSSNILGAAQLTASGMEKLIEQLRATELPSGGFLSRVLAHLETP